MLESRAVNEIDFLVVDKLTKRFPTKGGREIFAVREVSFRQTRGETIGIVGESGCGKSTLGRLVLNLIRPSSGEVYLAGEALGALSAAALRRKWADMQMIFQDPQSSLDPRMRVGKLIEEPLIVHRRGGPRERKARVAELCDLVGLPTDAPNRFPHEFSGGQRQRISIARALALSPSLIVADEPVSALDVSLQAQILNLLVDLRRSFGLTYLFISHDLAVIRHISDAVAVMYLGEIVEYASVDDLFDKPAHPYTKTLLAAMLDTEPNREKAYGNLQGEPPNPDAPPSGCSFHPRCPSALAQCHTSAPPELDIGTAATPHRVRCWLHA